MNTRMIKNLRFFSSLGNKFVRIIINFLTTSDICAMVTGSVGLCARLSECRTVHWSVHLLEYRWSCVHNSLSNFLRANLASQEECTRARLSVHLSPCKRKSEQDAQRQQTVIGTFALLWNFSIMAFKKAGQRPQREKG